MAEAHGGDWAQIFAEILQNLANQLEGGNSSALSEFMNSESMRVLGSVQTLRLPGNLTRGDGGGDP